MNLPLHATTKSPASLSFMQAISIFREKKSSLRMAFIGILLALASCQSDENSSPPANEPDPTGTILIKINTVGKDEDPNGYDLIVEGSGTRQVGPVEEVRITNKRAGTYAVELSGIAGHCTGTGNMVREVIVTANGTATVEFEVDCKAILRDRLVYLNGPPTFTEFKLHTSKLDGTDEKILLDKIVPSTRMSISPDGTKIAFNDLMEGTSIFQIFTMDADGENVEMIPFEPNENPAFTSQILPVWHPDGKKLTFRNANRTVTFDLETKTRTVLQFDPGEVFVVSEVIENGNRFLGTYIISSPGVPFEQKLVTMNLDGSDIRILKEGINITFNSAILLDENSIAYIQRENVQGQTNEVWKINLDGTEDLKISDKFGFSQSEVLNSFTASPDGTEFIFFVTSSQNYYLSRTKVNGTPQILNFSSAGVRINPEWSRISRN